jgi:S-methyl-5-thioribose-1-phosphate isomerase
MERALDWDDGAIAAVDQTALPARLELVRLATVDDVVDAIRRLVVRGAPVIGITGALGVALAARHRIDSGGRVDEDAVRRDAQRIVDSRPTAVNLRWAVDRVLTRLSDGPDAVLAEGLAILADDEQATDRRPPRCRRAAGRVPGPLARVLTHCNTAPGDHGRRHGARRVRALARDGRLAEVIATETRPLLQGARLTVWELHRDGLPHRLCVDSAAPAAMATGLVDAVVVGADRIAANGDTANKIGTYALACAAAHNRIPFVVVAPQSTVDTATPDGAGIPIEERDAAEVVRLAGSDTTVPGTRAYNPAFDVTPAELITAIVTEQGVWRP